MANEFTLGGMTFTLKKIRYGIHSDETPDYMADLYCGKDLIARVSNDGHGGNTRANWNPDKLELARSIEAEVRKHVWLTCQDGTKIHYDLGTVADEILYITERNRIISRNQKRALVLEKEGEADFTLRQFNITVEEAIARCPEQLKREIARVRQKGYTIVNTNIPEEFLK